MLLQAVISLRVCTKDAIVYCTNQVVVHCRSSAITALAAPIKLEIVVTILSGLAPLIKRMCTCTTLYSTVRVEG